MRKKLLKNIWKICEYNRKHFLSTSIKPYDRITIRDSESIRKHFMNELYRIKENDAYLSERVLMTSQKPIIRLKGEKEVINLSSNNYLGLSNHPKVIEAAHIGLKTHGYGLSSVRYISGTQDIHKELEEKLSDFHRMEDTILYNSCYDANIGLFEALLLSSDIVFSDVFNHYSIFDGIKLSKAKMIKYKHMDMSDLEHHLSSQESKSSRIRIIATNGVFELDGQIAPLKEICNLAEKYDALVFLDDCHGIGVIGETGRGSSEHCEVIGKIDIINSTLGKALGGAAGGYTTGHAEIIEILRQRSKPYFFSTSLPPHIVKASITAINILIENPELLEILHDKTRFLKRKMKEAEFDIIDGELPIIPIIFQYSCLAYGMAVELINEGVFVTAFGYPMLNEATPRILMKISVDHEKNDLVKVADAFQLVGDDLGLGPIHEVQTTLSGEMEYDKGSFWHKS